MAPWQRRIHLCGMIARGEGAWVYILASKRNGTLYTGSTVDLARRIHEHREGMLPTRPFTT
jgi:putative endonuclease